MLLLTKVAITIVLLKTGKIQTVSAFFNLVHPFILKQYFCPYATTKHAA